MKFKPLTPTLEFDVPNSNASDEGDYQVYAVNRRNHTYGVSDISNAISVSKIAPKLTGISLFVVEDGEEDIALIVNNETVKVMTENGEKNAEVEIDGRHLAYDFRIDVADSFDNIGSEGDKPSLMELLNSHRIILMEKMMLHLSIKKIKPLLLIEILVLILLEQQWIIMELVVLPRRNHSLLLLV